MKDSFCVESEARPSTFVYRVHLGYTVQYCILGGGEEGRPPTTELYTPDPIQYTVLVLVFELIQDCRLPTADCRQLHLLRVGSGLQYSTLKICNLNLGYRILVSSFPHCITVLYTGDLFLYSVQYCTSTVLYFLFHS